MVRKVQAWVGIPVQAWIFLAILGTFRSWDENDYEYEIFS